MKKWLFLLLVVGLGACKKEKNSGTQAEKLFEQNILHRPFVVDLAEEDGRNITATFRGYHFILMKTDYYHGPLRAIHDGSVITGSWSTNDDFSKLVIELPAGTAQFDFLSTSWRFTKKGLPVMKLAPWGAASNKVLHMRRE